MGKPMGTSFFYSIGTLKFPCNIYYSRNRSCRHRNSIFIFIFNFQGLTKATRRPSDTIPVNKIVKQAQTRIVEYEDARGFRGKGCSVYVPVLFSVLRAPEYPLLFEETF